MRGRGLDAGLRGELHLTSPSGRLAVDGTLRAVDGTYQAYGQKLGIDRGVLTFTGAGREPAPRHRGDAAQPRRARRRARHRHGADAARAPVLRARDVGPRQAELARRSAAPATAWAAPTPRCCRAPRSRLLSGEGPGADRPAHAGDRPRPISVRQSEGEAQGHDRQRRQADLEALVRRLRARPERHGRQLAADLPHRPAPHGARRKPAATTRSTSTGRCAGASAARALRRDVPVGLLDVVLHEGVDGGGGASRDGSKSNSPSCAAPARSKVARKWIVLPTTS